MKKLFISFLMSLGIISSVFAQEERIFTIMNTNGTTTSFVMDENSRISFSDTQLLFFNGSETATFNLSEIRKAYFSVPQNAGEIENQSLTIYPNPTNDIIKIANLSDNKTVTIYSIKGEIIKQVTVSVEAEINVADLCPGMYFISTGNSVSKFVKM